MIQQYNPHGYEYSPTPSLRGSRQTKIVDLGLHTTGQMQTAPSCLNSACDVSMIVFRDR